MFNLFGSKKPKQAAPLRPPIDIHWGTNPKAQFYNLLFIKPEDIKLEGKSGVFVVWHGGSKPEWLFVDTAKDLADRLNGFRDDERVKEFYPRGGVYVTWSIMTSEYQKGIARFLNEKMEPVIENPRIDRLSEMKDGPTPVAVFFPGRQADSQKPFTPSSNV